MSVSEGDVRHIASLARISVTDDEVTTLTTDLNRILEHVDVLSGLSGEESDLTPQIREPLPSTRGEGAEQPDRLDLEPGVIAPAWNDGFFVVPPPPGLGASGDSETP